ncbi:MAG: FkbM family methyltransferase [Candidatus Dormibacterales bacterium]
MPQSVTTALRTIAKSGNPIVRLGKRMVIGVLQRMDVVAPARLKNGDVLYVDLANAVGRTIWVRGDYVTEPAIKTLIETNLEPGDVFFDVGANVGFFSLVAARAVGESGEVHAFEPLPELAALLRRTAAANGLNNLHVVEAAVGQGPGTAEMAVMKDSAYSHLIQGQAEVESDHGGWRSVSVATVSLDQYRDQKVGRPLRLMKMDIEGAELEAIEGARQLLSQPNAPDVICEVNPDHLARFGHAPKVVFQHFESMGFAAFDPETGRPMSVEDLSAHRQNVFFKKRRS